jgi:hypothetical protein
MATAPLPEYRPENEATQEGQVFQPVASPKTPAPLISDLKISFLEYVHEAGSLFAATADLYERLRARAGETYFAVKERSADLAERTGKEAKRLKQERPLQLLGGVAVAAFAVGVLTRIWRSRNS